MKKIIIFILMFIILSFSVLASVSWNVPSTIQANTNFQITLSATSAGGYKILKPSNCQHISGGTLGTDNYVRNSIGGSGTANEIFRCSSSANFIGEYTIGNNWVNFPSKTVNIENSNGGVFCPTDVKECPDGTFVSRIPPSCEFASCPSECNPDSFPQKYIIKYSNTDDCTTAMWLGWGGIIIIILGGLYFLTKKR